MTRKENQELSIDVDKFTVYPNPVMDKLILLIPRDIVLNKIEVLDLLGKIHYIEDNFDQTYRIEINFSNMNSGVYLIKIDSSDKPEILRVIKN